MNNLIDFIQEKLKVNSKTKINQYEYHPKDKEELENIIIQLIKERGNKADLNDIDTSKIDDMSYLFNISKLTKFNGDISKWDVSNVTNMELMFSNSNFNGDISEWDVSNVVNMDHMFAGSHFNKDISNWDVSNVKGMMWMFMDSPFNKDISKWNVGSNVKTYGMFEETPLDSHPPKWYNE